MLLVQAGVDFDALKRLLNTRFLNRGGLLSVDFRGDPCSLDDAVLDGPDKLIFFDRLHRFLRLQLRLGWTEYELDHVIQALEVDDFGDSAFLPSLAAIKVLASETDLSIGELASWWSDLDTFQYEDALVSSYEAAFLDPLIYPDTGDGSSGNLRHAVFCAA